MLCAVAVDVVSPTDPIAGLRSQVENVAQDQRRDAADRVATLRDYRQRMVMALGALDTYVGSLEKLREAQAVSQQDVTEAVRANADAREEMLRIGNVSAGDLDEAGYLSHDELDALAEEGLLEEAAPLLVERVRAARALQVEETSISFDPHLHPHDRLGRFMETLHGLRPGGTVRLPNGGSIRRTSSGAQRYKLRAPDGGSTRTVTGVRAAARAAVPMTMTHADVDSALASMFDAADARPFDKQPFHDEESLYRAAGRDLPQFRRVLDMGLGVSRTLDAKVHVIKDEAALASAIADVQANRDRPFVMLGGVKGRNRAEEKVRTKYDGDWSRLADVLRASVITPTLAEVPQAVEAIKEQAKQNGWKVRAAENRFVARDDGINTGPLNSGYADVSMVLEGPDGLVAEVQVNTSAMFLAKETRGHVLYEEARTLQGKASLGRPLSPQERERVQELDQKSAEVYAEATRESYP